MSCFIILYDKMGKEVTTDLFGHPSLVNGDIIEHEGIAYEVRNKRYQTFDNCLYIRAFA